MGSCVRASHQRVPNRRHHPHPTDDCARCSSLDSPLLFISMPENGETAPLLAEGVPNLARTGAVESPSERVRRLATVRGVIYTVLTIVFVIALVTVLFVWDKVTGVVGRLPKDPEKAALYIMNSAPVIVSTLHLP